MDFKKSISRRLGGENFFLNSYYKFEKYSRLKNDYIKNNPTQAVLDFGIGELDELPPSYAIERLTKEVWKFENRVYADNGIDLFKQSAALHLKEIYQLSIADPLRQINHVLGAKSALCIIPMAFIDEGDVIISTTPGYEVLANFSCWLKATLYKAELKKENHFLPDLDAIPEEIYRKCKIFSINYPNNPTGAIATVDFYKKLVALALKYDFLIVNDCAYGIYSYKQKPLSILSIERAEQCAIEIHTFSKIFSMTGMRIGFVVGNPEVIEIIKQVKDNMDSGQYIPIQLAAVEGILQERNHIARMKKKYLERMKNVVKILNKNHLQATCSDGTFYLFVKVPETFQSADQFCRFLLDNAGIFTIPWDEVGHYVRFSMTFLCSTSETAFYKELDKRLQNLTRSLT